MNLELYYIVEVIEEFSVVQEWETTLKYIAGPFNDYPSLSDLGYDGNKYSVVYQVVEVNF